MPKDLESYERVSEAVMRQRTLRKVAELYVQLFRERGVSQAKSRAPYRQAGTPSVEAVLRLMHELGEDKNWSRETQNTEPMMQAMLRLSSTYGTE